MTAITKLVSILSKSQAKRIHSTFCLHKGRVIAHCNEHDHDELVEQQAYHTDLGHWYSIGLHPRFSILEAFYKAGQRRNEIGILIGQTSRRNEEDNTVATRAFFHKALKDSKTQKAFLTIMHPRLFVDLVNGDTTYRIDYGFKERFEAHSFTPEEFFAEPSQELRRLILRSGLSIQEVIKGLEFVAEDEEGKLYRMKNANTDTRIRTPFGNRDIQYLYVRCPSTGQEYLLGVPGNFKVPKEARRWTFGLEANAEFVKEA